MIAGDDVELIRLGAFATESKSLVAEDFEPATGRLLARIELASETEVDAAVRLAVQAQRAWNAVGVRGRAERIVALAELLERRAEDLARLESRDTGSPLRAMRADVAKGIATLRTYAGAALETHGATIPASPEGLHLTLPKPWGVVAAITAYNHPLLFACLRSAPALLAGNCVILKPAEQAPLSTIKFGRLAEEALPAGVLSVLPGDARAGEALVLHPDVLRISFTGSVESGLAVQMAAARSGRFKSLTLELGGKNPIIIFPDVGAAEAAAAIVKGTNFARVQGQSCGSTSRALIHERVHDDVLHEVVRLASKLRLGLPEDDATDVGSLISVSHRDRIMRAIAAGREAGATVVAGGGPPSGRDELAGGAYLTPTVLDGVDIASPVATTELFGPVLAVTHFSDEAEAVHLANATQYGLTASVWTRDIDCALRVADQLEVGYVWINDVETRYPGVPFGGWKQSGIGTEQGLASEILSYTRSKSLNVRVRPAPEQDG